MKTVIPAVIMMLSMFQTKLPVSIEYSKEEVIDTTLIFSDNLPRVLSVGITRGSVNIVGHDGQNVEVKMFKKLIAVSKDKLAQAKKDAGVEFKELKDTLAIQQAAPWRLPNNRVEDQSWKKYGYDVITDIQLRVPHHMKTALTTVIGNINVGNMNGEFNATTTRGDISLSGMRQSGSATTVNGHITLQFVDVPTQNVTCKTSTGNIEASFPPALSGAVSANTEHGEVVTDFQGSVREKTTVEADAKENNHAYRITKSYLFVVGREHPELSFQTVNGNISLLRNQ